MELSESIEKRRKQQKNYLIFTTIGFIVIILIYAVLYLLYRQNQTLMYLIGSILLGMAVIGLGWTQFYHQKKKDEGNHKEENTEDKVMAGINIAQGINLRIHSFAYSIAAIISLFGGIYSLIMYRDTFRLSVGILLIIIGIGLIYVVINDNKVSKIKLKGRNY